MAEPSTSHPPEPSGSRCPRIRAWLQLMRIANLPTAVSNVAAGAALATWINVDGPPLFDLTLFLIAVTASTCLYTSGMILNDAFDADVDAIERPKRPIPSGRINRSTAFTVGFSLIVIAIAAPTACLACWTLLNFEHTLQPLLGMIGTIVMLSVCIVLYNGPLKRTWLASPTMGSCRTLNIWLGTFTAVSLHQPSWLAAHFDQRWFLYSMSIGLFVTGITLLARSETKRQQSRLWLAIGAATMLIALGLLALLPLYDSHIPRQTYVMVKQAYWSMLGMITFPTVYRLVTAVRQATPSAVGRSIVTSLGSLIFLDAAVCFLEHPDQPLYAGGVALLIVPVIILRRFSAQT